MYDIYVDVCTKYLKFNNINNNNNNNNNNNTPFQIFGFEKSVNKIYKRKITTDNQMGRF